MRDDFAVDAAGRPLPYTAEQIRAVVDKALADPDSQLVAVVLRQGNDLMVPVLGAPSLELVEIFEHVAKTLRLALRGQ